MDISQTIQALDQTAIVLGISPRINIQGSTSPDGGKELNKNLSVRRAKAVLNELAKGHYRASILMAEGMGPDALLALSSGDKSVSQGRHVAFQVVLTQSK
jgi:outer membrane protein OmpA-like peptidoglycan-associated protein